MLGINSWISTVLTVVPNIQNIINLLFLFVINLWISCNLYRWRIYRDVYDFRSLFLYDWWSFIDATSEFVYLSCPRRNSVAVTFHWTWFTCQFVDVSVINNIIVWWWWWLYERIIQGCFCKSCVGGEIAYTQGMIMMVLMLVE